MYSTRAGGASTNSNGNTPNQTPTPGAPSASLLPAFSHPHSGIRTPPNGPSPHGSPFTSYHPSYAATHPHYHPHSSMSRASSVGHQAGAAQPSHNIFSPANSHSAPSGRNGVIDDSLAGDAHGQDSGDDDDHDEDDDSDNDDEDDEEDEEDDEGDNEEDEDEEDDEDQNSPVSNSNRPLKRKRNPTDNHTLASSKSHPSAHSHSPAGDSQHSPATHPKPKPPRGSKACTHCRKLKMRCTGGENGPPCDRCKHSGYTCVFEESNRGKKAAANAAAAAKAKAEKQEAAARAKAAAAAAAAASSSLTSSYKGPDGTILYQEPPSLMSGFPSHKTKKTKQSNQDLARSLEKMEATLNTVLRTMRDPAHAHSLGQASGMLTRPQSPARDEKPRTSQHHVPSIAPGTIDPAQTQAPLSGSIHHHSNPASHAARYASMAPSVAFQGHGPGTAVPQQQQSSRRSATTQNTPRRPPSPRLHSLPPDNLNPLGLLAEASLGNQISANRRSKSSASGSSATTGSATMRGNSHPAASHPLRRGTSDGGQVTAGGTNAGAKRGKSADGNSAGEEEEEAAAIRKGSWTSTDAPALGVASKAYFRPGPMSMLPLRKVIIDRELPPELLTSGIVSDAEVLDLFSIFFHNCAQHIILLDPEWHTPQFVCGRSPFLFTVILAIASRYYAPRPDLHAKCLQQATKEAFRCLEKGFKSIEIVQAFLLLTMWGQPARRFEEDKSWIYAGIAFRVATDLNLHRKSAASTQQNAQQPLDDPAVLERDKEVRNRERTWIFCFVVDRSLSSQMGKPSVIREDFIIRNTRSWALERNAALSDVALGALTDLLRLTSRQMELLYSSQTSVTGLNTDLDFSAMIKIFHEQMEEWRGFWQVRGLLMTGGSAQAQGVPVMDSTLSAREIEMSQLYAAASRPDPPPDDADHTMRTLYFLIQQAPLRYHYASLVIHSFGLQFGNTMDRGAYFHRCYEAAKGVYFAARDGMRPVLRYAPDTQILIISFALIFMLKLTRPTFSNYADSEEIFTLVEEGADMLEDVAAGPTHTPALYGHFIRSTLSHAKAEKAARNSNEGTQGYPSRATSPNASGYPDGSKNATMPSAASAFELPSDAALDPMLGAGTAGVTSGRATRQNSISGMHSQQQQQNQYDGSNIFGAGAGFGTTAFPASHTAPPFSFPNGMSLGSGAGGMGFGSASSGTDANSALAFSGSDLNSAAGSFMLDSVWWNQLVPAGLGGPLDGLNGGIDMQPVVNSMNNNYTSNSNAASRSQSIHIPHSAAANPTSSNLTSTPHHLLGGSSIGDGFGSIVGMGLDLGASLGLSTSGSSPDRSAGVVGVGTGATRPNSPSHREQTVRFEEEEEAEQGTGLGGNDDETPKLSSSDRSDPPDARSASANVDDSKAGVKDSTATTGATQVEGDGVSDNGPSTDTRSTRSKTADDASPSRQQQQQQFGEGLLSFDFPSNGTST